MKSIIYIFLAVSLFACTEGAKKIQVAGVSEPIRPSYNQAGFSNPPSPVDPDIAFSSPYAPGTHPFTRSTSLFLISVAVNNPNNEVYTHRWFLNNVEQPGLATTYPMAPQPFPVDPSSFIQFPNEGVQNVTSSLFDSSGKIIASEVWNFTIAVNQNPSYSSTSPLPAPDYPFPGTPFSPSDAPTVISVVISNLGGNTFFNQWTVNGTLQGALTTDQTEPPEDLIVDPSDTVTWPPGNYTVTAQLVGNPTTTTIYQSVTWNFEIRDFEDPSFSTFVDPQLPAPEPFPDVEFASGTVSLDPNTLNNLDNREYTLEWQLDSVVQASSTFNYSGSPGTNPDPPEFIIDPVDQNLIVGAHSVILTLWDSTTPASATVLETVSWAFNVVLPPPTTISDTQPATSTVVAAIENVPLDGTATNPGSFSSGFYIAPVPDDDGTRGAALQIGTNDFCVQVDDSFGVGTDPTSSGVLVNFEVVPGSPINTAPLQFFKANPNISYVCLSGAGAINEANGVPNFQLGVIGITTLTARVYDKLSLQTIGTRTWTIRVEPNNTPPVITIDTTDNPTPPPVLLNSPSPATVTQDATLTFYFTVEDKDSLNTGDPGFDQDYSVSFFFGSLAPPPLNPALDGTNTFYSSGTEITPDCFHDMSFTTPNAEDKFRCTFQIPSSNGVASQPPGTYYVNAVVQDAPQFGSGTGLASNQLNWTLNVLEVNDNAPVLVNPVLLGAANPATNSYILDLATPLMAINSATEGATITFTMLVDDLEKDNFTIIASHDYSVPATPTEFHNTTGHTIAGISNPGDNPAVFSYWIPYDVVTGAADASITFTITLIDEPDSGTPLAQSSTFDFVMNIIDSNPAPEFGSPTVETPPYNATATVVRGYPYSFDIDEIRDTSIGDGDGILWQWQVSSDPTCGTATSVPPWQDIIGATQGVSPILAPTPASITWFAPAHFDGDKYCMRNCIGDDGFGNPADCSVPIGIAGPWAGTGDGIVTGYEADRAVDSGVAQNLPGLGAWSDGNQSVYTVHANNNELYVVRTFYSLDGTSSNGDWISFTSDDVDPEVDEYPYNISITGNANYIFVSYIFNESNGTTGTPLMRIVRIKKNTPGLGDIYYIKPTATDVVSGIGNAVADDSAVYLPYLRSVSGDDIWYFYADGATDGTPTVSINIDMNLGVVATELQSTRDPISNNPNGTLVLAPRLKTGEINLYNFNMPGNGGPLDIGTPSTETNIFLGALINFYTLAAGQYNLNNKVYVAAQNIVKEIIFRRFRGDDLFPETGVIDYDSADIPNLDNVTQMVATAGTQDTIFYLATVVENPAPASGTYNSVGIRVEDITVTANDISPILNSRSPHNVGNVRPAITTMAEKFEIGSAGAVTDENKKDTFWFLFADQFAFTNPPTTGTSAPRLIIINSEPEIYSGEKPATGTESASEWTIPWFRQ